MLTSCSSYLTSVGVSLESWHIFLFLCRHFTIRIWLKLPREWKVKTTNQGDQTITCHSTFGWGLRCQWSEAPPLCLASVPCACCGEDLDSPPHRLWAGLFLSQTCWGEIKFQVFCASARVELLEWTYYLTSSPGGEEMQVRSSGNRSPVGHLLS